MTIAPWLRPDALEYLTGRSKDLIATYRERTIDGDLFAHEMANLLGQWAEWASHHHCDI